MAWFTGGLFDDDSALPLNREGVETALKAVALDWSEIDLSILGRLLAEWESEKAMIAAAPERAEAARMRQRRQLADGLLRAFPVSGWASSFSAAMTSSLMASSSRWMARLMFKSAHFMRVSPIRM